MQVQLELDLSRAEITKLSDAQSKNQDEMERLHIECEKLKDRQEKLQLENDRLRADMSSKGKCFPKFSLIENLEL